MIIASGRSVRNVGAIANHLLKAIRAAGFGTAHVEGLSQGDWVLIDTGDIIIHLFRPEVREFYNLEKMWSPSLIDDEGHEDDEADEDDEAELSS
jgi:ribosome-associated protein